MLVKFLILYLLDDNSMLPALVISQIKCSSSQCSWVCILFGVLPKCSAHGHSPRPQMIQLLCFLLPPTWSDPLLLLCQRYPDFSFCFASPPANSWSVTEVFASHCSAKFDLLHSCQCGYAGPGIEAASCARPEVAGVLVLEGPRSAACAPPSTGLFLALAPSLSNQIRKNGSDVSRCVVTQ